MTSLKVAMKTSSELQDTAAAPVQVYARTGACD